MSPILPPSSGLRSFEGLMVFFPPLVSLRQGTVMIDARAVRQSMKEAPAGVRAVAFSSDPGKSPGALQVFHSMGEVLREGVDAVVSVRPVSEAVKVVDDSWVVGSLDRSTLVSVTLPILISRSTLATLLSATAEVLMDPIREIMSAGGSVRAVSQLT